MKELRYKITPDVTHLTLSTTPEGPTEQIHLQFEHKNLYFVDILDTTRKDRLVKMKIYLPNGEVAVGWQFLDWITLHGDIYDGRFNV